MSPRDELLKAAIFFDEAVAEYGDDEADDREFCAIIRDWLRDEANRHVHLGHLDSGYDDVSVWDHVSMTPEIVAMQPCIRMARLVNSMTQASGYTTEGCGHAATVPTLPATDR